MLQISVDCVNKTVVTVVSQSVDRPTASEACLVVIYGDDLGRKYHLDTADLLIGRSATSDIQIDQESVSRNHAEIIHDGTSHVLRDLGSTNGTYVNDRVVAEHVLRDRDFIQIGRTILKFLSGDNVENAYHEEIYRLTTIDGLTQIYNKRYFMETLEREIGRAQRYRRDVTLMMFDIDHFKRVNDTYGHLAGDYVLKHLAGTVKLNVRREDVFARYGGEEFALVLPEMDLPGSRLMAEKLRRLVETTRFQFDGAELPVTISLGLAGLEPACHDPLELIRRADEKLYEAKQGGRNRVCG